MWTYPAEYSDCCPPEGEHKQDPGEEGAQGAVGRTEKGITQPRGKPSILTQFTILEGKQEFRIRFIYIWIQIRISSDPFPGMTDPDKAGRKETDLDPNH